MVLDEWNALKAHIDGFGVAAKLGIAAHAADHIRTNEVSYIEKSAEVLKEKIDAFFDKFRTELPEACRQSYSNLVINKAYHNGPPSHSIAAVAAPLLIFSSEFTYLLTDTQQVIHHLSQRSFAHLKRSIIASSSTRQEWQDAFNKHETACEWLGAAHLLLHGIFAFKVDAKGGRTDLIFKDHNVIQSATEVAEGLVLTEWKLVKNVSDLNAKLLEAKRQADSYQSSTLTGIELRNYRYLVLVSEHQISMPHDLKEGNITYHYVNIAVDPFSPSKASK